MSRHLAPRETASAASWQGPGNRVVAGESFLYCSIEGRGLKEGTQQTETCTVTHEPGYILSNHP
ncbi:MAG: hypothetical protein IKF90_12790 [Parasporobacterium sp.]|nr:hypothetical protein [Parasporobacterium sp.]